MSENYPQQELFYREGYGFTLTGDSVEGLELPFTFSDYSSFAEHFASVSVPHRVTDSYFSCLLISDGKNIYYGWLDGLTMDGEGEAFCDAFIADRTPYPSSDAGEFHDEISCRNCGDGGCVHCEPNRFF